MKKVIIFDLDGTLLDTLDDLRLSVNFALSRYNYPPRSREQVRKDIGNGVEMLIKRSILNGFLDVNYQNCLYLFRQSYKEKYNVRTRPYYGCFDLIEKLKEEGYIVTVATNKIYSIAKDLLDTHYPGLFDYFQGDKDGVKKKPDPQMIYEIIYHYGVTPDDVVYIGDTDVDEETALNANVPYGLVTYGYRTKGEIKKSCTTTTLLDDPEAVYKFIKSLR